MFLLNLLFSNFHQEYMYENVIHIYLNFLKGKTTDLDILKFTYKITTNMDLALVLNHVK